MRAPLIAAMAAAVTLAGCSTYGTDSRYRGYSSYDYNRVDPAYNGYYADRYYVDGPRYRERRLSRATASIAARTVNIIAGVTTAPPA